MTVAEITLANDSFREKYKNNFYMYKGTIVIVQLGLRSKIHLSLDLHKVLPFP